MAQISQQSTALVAMIDKEKASIAKLLPTFMADQKDRFFELALSMSRTPAIGNCSATSVLQSIFRAAQWGLMPDGVNAALVPYGADCTFVPMYRGLIQAYRRSGEIKNVWADVVFAADKLELVRGTEPQLVHVPDLTVNRVEDTGVVGAYACARWTNGSVDFVYMNRSELDAIRNRSRAKNGPWKTDPVAMFKKCPIRRLASILPLTTDVQVLAAEDEKMEMADLEIQGETVAAPAQNLEGLLGVQDPPPPEIWYFDIRIDERILKWDEWKGQPTGSKHPLLQPMTWDQLQQVDTKHPVVPVMEAMLKDAAGRQAEKGVVGEAFQRAAVAWNERHKRLISEELKKEADSAW